jgi:hypothetical protein
MIRTCTGCGGLYATENGEAYAGTPCPSLGKCGLPATAGTTTAVPPGEAGTALTVLPGPETPPAEQTTPAEEMEVMSPPPEVSPEVRGRHSDADILDALDMARLSVQYPICGYVSLRKDKSMEVCRRKAGLYSKHEGRGLCMQHDTGGHHILPVSPYARHLANCVSVQELFMEAHHSQEQFMGLNNELTMARTILMAQLQRLETQKGTSLKQEVYSNILQCLEAIRKLSESSAKIKVLSSQYLTMEGLHVYLLNLCNILEQELIDPKMRVRVLERIATEAVFPQG